MPSGNVSTAKGTVGREAHRIEEAPAMAIVLNCDMGEAFGLYRCGDDEGIMPLIHSPMWPAASMPPTRASCAAPCSSPSSTA